MINKGFSLIELLVVMVIIGLTLGVVTANLGNNKVTVLNSAAREVSSALRFCRGHALTYRKETAIQFNLENNSYQLTDRKKVYKIAKEIEITLELADSQIMDSNQGAIRFYPDGSSTGGRVTLEIEENKRQLDINWLTGMVEIAPY